MININTYVKRFGKKTFKKMPFNDVDGLVLSEISMINFEYLLKDETTIAFKDIVLDDYKKVIYGSPDASKNVILLKSMIKYVRYKDIRVGYIKRAYDDTNPNQFYAITMILPDDTLFISFRGTDITLTGWKEDFALTYQDKIPSYDQAVQYVNNILSILPGKYNLIGHSKGGHLAEYSALNINKEYINRLENVYNYDGPGFLNGIEQYPNYPFVYAKFKKFITHRDMIGVLFNTIPYEKIVYSPGILLGGHDPFSWKIDNEKGEFIARKKRKTKYEIYDVAMNMWVNQLSYDDKILASKALFKLVGKAVNVYDLLKYMIPNIANFNSVIKTFPKNKQKRLREIAYLFFDCRRIAKETKSLLNAKTILLTKRLMLREMINEDRDALSMIITDPETMKYYPKPYDDNGVNRWIKWCIDSYKKNNFGLWSVVYKETGKMIGDCGISMQKINNIWRPEIGYHLNKDYHQQGIGKEMSQAVRDYFFTHYDFDEVYSYMNKDNIPSRKTAEANGMTLVEEYIEDDTPHLVYRITREEWKNLT